MVEYFGENPSSGSEAEMAEGKNTLADSVVVSCA